MNALPPVISRQPSDDAIRAMLVDRADRVRPEAIDVAALVAGTPREGARAGRFANVGPRLSIAAALAIIVVGSALVVGPLVERPAGSATPSGSSPASAIASEPPSSVHALDAAELGGLARTRSTELAPRIAVVRGIVTITYGARGCAAPACTTGQLLGTGDGLDLLLTADLIADFAVVGSSTVAGPFVVQFTTATAEGQPVVNVLDRLITDQPDGWTSSVGNARMDDPRGGAAYAAVEGWLVRAPLHSCPSFDRFSLDSSVVATCQNEAYLTTREFQPLQADGSSIGAAEALTFASGAYETWAPDPAPYGQGGVVPRKAVYLLHRDAFTCNAIRLEGCSMMLLARHWSIVGRLEPIP
jgi:hypothetical protein